MQWFRVKLFFQNLHRNMTSKLFRKKRLEIKQPITSKHHINYVKFICYGHDGLPTHIINHSITTFCFVGKSGNCQKEFISIFIARIPSDSRPISIPSALLKVFEILMATQTNEYLNNYSLKQSSTFETSKNSIFLKSILNPAKNTFFSSQFDIFERFSDRASIRFKWATENYEVPFLELSIIQVLESGVGDSKKNIREDFIYEA